MSPDVLGWCASTVLIATLANQIHTQLKENTARGVSRWLFAGQSIASLGFIAYSWMLYNCVFITTNAPILLTAIVGQMVFWRRRRRAR